MDYCVHFESFRMWFFQHVKRFKTFKTQFISVSIFISIIKLAYYRRKWVYLYNIIFSFILPLTHEDLWSPSFPLLDARTPLSMRFLRVDNIVIYTFFSFQFASISRTVILLSLYPRSKLDFQVSKNASISYLFSWSHSWIAKTFQGIFSKPTMFPLHGMHLERLGIHCHQKAKFLFYIGCFKSQLYFPMFSNGIMDIFRQVSLFHLYFIKGRNGQANSQSHNGINLEPECSFT